MALSQGLSYSVGFGLSQDMVDKINQIPDPGWTPAYDADGKVRDGAWVTELTGMLELNTWPAGMWVIIRAERPHPGAQLRFTDVDGNRLTAFVTNTTRGQLADLELRHRRRARCEDRIRSAKNTGLRNLPLTAFTQNQIWIAAVQLATELTSWLQMLALTGTGARRWEPNGSGCNCFQWPGPSPADHAASGCTYPVMHRTGTFSPPALPACTPSHSPPDRQPIHPHQHEEDPPEVESGTGPGDHREL